MRDLGQSACQDCLNAPAGVLHAHNDYELTMWISEGLQVLHDGVLQQAACSARTLSR